MPDRRRDKLTLVGLGSDASVGSILGGGRERILLGRRQLMALLVKQVWVWLCRVVFLGIAGSESRRVV